VAFIQKNEKIKEKDKHPTILKIPDELWDKIKSIFPKEKSLKTVGSSRPIVRYRKVIDGIIYVLRTGCPWKMLPKEYGSGSNVIVDFNSGIALTSSKRDGSEY
jgi:transposase